MVKDIDHGWKKLVEAIAALRETPSVVVGVTAEAGSDLVVIAATNEFGSDDGHVPERSYLRSTIDDGEVEALDDLQAATEAVLDGTSTVDQAFGLVGEKWVGRVKETIAGGVAPENAPSTIAKKGSSTPLIDNGRLRNSITHDLRYDE